jgi:serine/threonine-protein kinase HipA
MTTSEVAGSDFRVPERRPRGATGDPTTPAGAYVWVWLPGSPEPVVAGFLAPDGEILAFNYGRSYLERPDAVPLYLPELPLRRGRIRPLGAMTVAGCLSDSGPDAWGQRVVLARLTDRRTAGRDTAELSMLTYLLESGSDRIGALDFQASPTRYVARAASATLEEMLTAADRLEAGEPLSPALNHALLRGTSIGGARPKVLVDHEGRTFIGKLASSTDPYPVVKAEAVGMELARRVGLDTSETRITSCLGKDVLLVRRFDRTDVPGQRRMLVSALTILGLDEMEARYATYPALADEIRRRFTDPKRTLRELYARIVFNVCIGNTDDHARNHAAFWDGRQLTLSPAYDLCPQPRSGEEAAQAMAIGRNGERRSRFRTCVAAAETYLLTRAEARDVIEHQVTTIEEHWPDAADAARLTDAERRWLWRRQILNPAVHHDS